MDRVPIKFATIDEKFTKIKHKNIKNVCYVNHDDPFNSSFLRTEESSSLSVELFLFHTYKTPNAISRTKNINRKVTILIQMEN